MAFKGLTINTLESADPHVFAEDDAAIYGAILGDGDMVLPYGDAFALSIQSYNTVRVSSGLLAMQGHIGIIEKDDYQDIVLDNGSSGVSRTDLIVAQFTTTGMHGTDEFKLVAITGTPGSTNAPAYTAEDLNNGGKLRQFPIAKVTITSLSVTAVESLNTTMMTMREMADILRNRITSGTGNPSGGKDGDIYIKYEA